MADITIPGTPRKSVTVDLVGTEYKARAPKAAVAVFLSKELQDAPDSDAVLTAVYKWCRVIFGKEVGEKVFSRIKSPTDDLDIPDMTHLISALLEEFSGNPTTSSADS